MAKSEKEKKRGIVKGREIFRLAVGALSVKPWAWQGRHNGNTTDTTIAHVVGQVARQSFLSRTRPGKAREGNGRLGL